VEADVEVGQRVQDAGHERRPVLAVHPGGHNGLRDARHGHGHGARRRRRRRRRRGRRQVHLAAVPAPLPGPNPPHRLRPHLPLENNIAVTSLILLAEIGTLHNAASVSRVVFSTKC